MLSFTTMQRGGGGKSLAMLKGKSTRSFGVVFYMVALVLSI